MKKLLIKWGILKAPKKPIVAHFISDLKNLKAATDKVIQADNVDTVICVEICQMPTEQSDGFSEKFIVMILFTEK